MTSIIDYRDHLDKLKYQFLRSNWDLTRAAHRKKHILLSFLNVLVPLIRLTEEMQVKSFQKAVIGPEGLKREVSMVSDEGKCAHKLSLINHHYVGLLQVQSFVGSS